MANQPAAQPGSALWTAQMRRTLALAKQEEIKLKAIEGQMISVETVKRIWEQVAAAIRSKMLSLPTKVAPMVIAARTAAEAQGILKQHVYEALDELSRLQLDTPGSTTRTDRQRVGRPKAAAQS